MITKYFFYKKGIFFLEKYLNYLEKKLDDNREDLDFFSTYEPQKSKGVNSFFLNLFYLKLKLILLLLI